MRLTTRSCRLGGTTSARMKRWQLSGSTVGGVIGLPAFGDGPVWCRKRSRWSTPPSHCLPPTTLMEQRQNSPCHFFLNTLQWRSVGGLWRNCAGVTGRRYQVCGKVSGGGSDQQHGSGAHHDCVSGIAMLVSSFQDRAGRFE